jgi:hypothetical protein
VLACACIGLPSVVVNVVGAAAAVVVVVGNIHHNRKVVAAVVDNTVAYYHPGHLVLYPMNTKEEDTGYSIVYTKLISSTHKC